MRLSQPQTIFKFATMTKAVMEDGAKVLMRSVTCEEADGSEKVLESLPVPRMNKMEATEWGIRQVDASLSQKLKIIPPLSSGGDRWRGELDSGRQEKLTVFILVRYILSRCT